MFHSRKLTTRELIPSTRTRWQVNIIDISLWTQRGIRFNCRLIKSFVVVFVLANNYLLTSLSTCYVISCHCKKHCSVKRFYKMKTSHLSKIQVDNEKKLA